MVDGKFRRESLGLDPATPAGKKGPNYSHYHKEGNTVSLHPNPGYFMKHAINGYLSSNLRREQIKFWYASGALKFREIISFHP